MGKPKPFLHLNTLVFLIDSHRLFLGLWQRPKSKPGFEMIEFWPGNGAKGLLGQDVDRGLRMW